MEQGEAILSDRTKDILQSFNIFYFTFNDLIKQKRSSSNAK